MPEEPQTCMMADCEDVPAHFCVQHVLEVHCPALDKAVAQERERCAKIADDYGQRRVAAAIRAARKETQ